MPSRLALVGLLVQAGCAGSTSGSTAIAPPNPGTLITQEKIGASGVKTAWEAPRLTVPSVQLRESRGKPARIQRRGRASISLDDQVLVIADNVRVYDLQLFAVDTRRGHPHYAGFHEPRRHDVLRRDVHERRNRHPHQAVNS